jgi:hypothetical protein
MINLAATLARLAAGAVLLTTAGAASAEPKYPDFSGQWVRIAVPGLPGQPSYDPTKGWGKYQQAPLTPEYQAILDANIKDQENGGHGKFLGWTCLPYGMPMMMYGFLPIELVVTPKTTYVLEGFMDALRRIYTDERDFADVEPTWQGYSVGRWIDVDGDGTYDVLEVETRNFKGPRYFDEGGIPLHVDNQSIFKERFYLDKDNPDILHDELTTIDHALSRPWTVVRNYRRAKADKAVWIEFLCNENNPHVLIGGDNYYLSADGLLMPARKNQSPPDLRYFKRSEGRP